MSLGEVHLCPAHMEKTPSCILRDDGTLHCLSCGAEGSWERDGGVLKMSYEDETGEKTTVWEVGQP